jgi:hypothetical protein
VTLHLLLSFTLFHLSSTTSILPSSNFYIEFPGVNRAHTKSNMADLKVGDSFPEGVTFSYVPYTEEKSDITACGIPINYNASKGWSPLPSKSRYPITPPSSSPIAHRPSQTLLLSPIKPIINTPPTEWATKKVVLFSVPGAFTPGCSVKHLPGFIENLSKLKSKGVDVVACIAYNDAFVMSAWGKANSMKGDDIVRLFSSPFLFLCLYIPSFPSPSFPPALP